MTTGDLIGDRSCTGMQFRRTYLNEQVCSIVRLFFSQQCQGINGQGALRWNPGSQ
jgi:hypothetical protein